MSWTNISEQEKEKIVKSFPTLSTATSQQTENFAREIADAWMSNRPIRDLKTVIFALSIIQFMNEVIEQNSPAGTVTYPKEELEAVKPIRVEES